jgi:cation transport regulator ChaB
MPYDSVSELPDRVKGLPESAQKQFLAVVNKALRDGKDESDAFTLAWGVIKKNYVKKDGKWVKKMSDDLKFIVPFSEREDGWYFYFPIGREVYHHGKSHELTPSDAQEMVANFKEHDVPGYDLPINVLHRDSAGIYGNIADLRATDTEVQWRPSFRDGKDEEIKDKGYRYTSPEIWFRDYQANDGNMYNNVAMGIAFTPRPRLGRDTAFFSDEDGWVIEEAEVDEEQIAKSVFEKLKGWFNDTFSLPEDEFGMDNDTEDMEDDMSELEEKFAELEGKLNEQSAQITNLSEQLQEANDALEAERSEKKEALTQLSEIEREKRLVEFTDGLKEIKNLEADDVAPALMKLHDEDEEAYEKIHTTLVALSNQIDESELFGERGHSGVNEGVESKIDALVSERVEKFGEDEVTALEKVLSQNPGLYAEYDKKTVKSIKADREE